ncbi:MAG: TIGR04100 family radical SAM protein [Eubacteriales bacterium]|nr:TIGR04100 family radical SAM protein [Eubacteriales bacterium]
MNDYIGGVLYEYGSSLYVNITNRCPCKCEFCIRDMTSALGGADSLWLKREPSSDEVKEMIRNMDLSPYDEIVFCGYGEPLVRIDDVIEIATFIKENYFKRVRVNTNGLSDLIHKKNTAPMLEGVIDAISISLNAPTKEKYNKLCHPIYGEAALPAIIDFTKNIKNYVPEVTMSIVNVISSEDLESCRKIAEGLGVDFRIR